MSTSTAILIGVSDQEKMSWFDSISYSEVGKKSEQRRKEIRTENLNRAEVKSAQNKAIEKFHHLLQLCVDDDLKLNVDSCHFAGNVLEALSEKTEWIEKLTLSATPQGEVVLRWKNPDRGTFAMIVDAVGVLHYAGIIDGQEQNGKEFFNVIETIPAVIKNAIEAIVKRPNDAHLSK
jgi:hydroxypyruvate isomerase